MAEAETIVQFPHPRPRLHCLACHEEGPAPCNCGAAIVTVDEARKLRKTDAHARYAKGETQEQIARDWRVSQRQISEDLKDLSLEETSKPPRPKGGRPMGKRKGSPRQPKVPPQDAETIASMILDRGMTDKQAQEATGWSSTVVRTAVAKEQGRREAEAAPPIEAAALPLSAQAKLAAARRQMQRALNAEHAARMAAIDEEVRLKLLERTKERLAMLDAMETEARETKDLYQTFMARQKKIFSKDEFRLIVMCVHADASISADKRNDATRLLIASRFALTGEK